MTRLTRPDTSKQVYAVHVQSGQLNDDTLNSLLVLIAEDANHPHKNGIWHTLGSSTQQANTVIVFALRRANKGHGRVSVEANQVPIKIEK